MACGGERLAARDAAVAWTVAARDLPALASIAAILASISALAEAVDDLARVVASLSAGLDGAGRLLCPRLARLVDTARRGMPVAAPLAAAVPELRTPATGGRAERRWLFGRPHCQPMAAPSTATPTRSRGAYGRTVRGPRVTSWMFHPGTPVHSFTRLARSSVFAVSNGEQLHFVGAGHVTHPWMFPDLYPHDSLPVLRVLSGAHVRYTLDFPNVSDVTGCSRSPWRVAGKPHRRVVPRADAPRRRTA